MRVVRSPGGPAQRPRKRIRKAQGSIGWRDPFGPVHKSFCGTDGRHGTTETAGPNPRSRGRRAQTDSALTGGSRDEETSRPAHWRNGTWARSTPTKQGADHPRTRCETAKGRANPTSVAGTQTVPARPREQPDQRARYARRKERRPRMTCSGGVSKLNSRMHRRREAIEKPHGRECAAPTNGRAAGRSAARDRTPERDGPRVGCPRAARRGRGTLKGRETSATSREVACGSVRAVSRAGGQSAGPVTKVVPHGARPPKWTRRRMWARALRRAPR
jgi:hypothetical protein